MNPFFAVFSLLFLSLSVQATDPVGEPEILAKRGKGVVTQAAFTARADKIPASARLTTLRDGGRLQDVINTLLLRSQLAADAREAGFNKEELVKARMQLAAEAELAQAWVQHYLDIQPKADYEQLAREYYEVQKDDMLTSPTIDVSHILISSKERSQENSLELATSLSQQLEKDPLKFDELVTEYSDDPSAASNAGKFYDVKKGDMVKPFEEAAFSLEKGEISRPVRTEYGYHIIRLDAFKAAESVSFEEVKVQLIERQRKQHEDRIKRDYLGRLTSLDVEMSEEQLTEMVNRLFGEDYIDPHTAGKDLK